MIRKAEMLDLCAAKRVYKIAREEMKRTGNESQWGDSYPSEDIMKDDIKREQLYLGEDDGAIYFIFMLTDEKEEEYARIYDGSWLNDEPYITLHRVASDGRIKGVFNRIFDFALQKMDELGIFNIRIDTHEDNLTMQAILKKHGFKKCGLVNFKYGGERIAYQYRREN